MVIIVLCGSEARPTTIKVPVGKRERKNHIETELNRMSEWQDN